MFFPHLIHIKSKDLVLEIGPGAYPHWRADCCADKFAPNDNVDLGQFGGKQMKTSGKPLFKIENGILPFKDKVFDYIICSHVLEHVEENELPILLKEIERVGKKYYLEFPTVALDYVYNYSVHTNFMDIIGNTIICMPKIYSNIQAVKPYTDFMYALRLSQNMGVEEFYPELFVVGKEFSGAIQLKIIKSPQEFFDLIMSKYTKQIPLCRPSFVFKTTNKIKKIVSEFLLKKKPEYFKDLLK